MLIFSTAAFLLVRYCLHKETFVASVVPDKVLGVSTHPITFFFSVQAWADAFRSSPDLTGVVCVYEDLRRKGMKFPVAEMCSPIHTPNKVHTFLHRFSHSIVRKPFSSSLTNNKMCFETNYALIQNQNIQIRYHFSTW